MKMVRVKRRSIALKITALFLIYLALAAIFNISWRLLHLPPQMRHGVLDPGLMLLSGFILLACILAASALTLHWFENRPLSSVGVPLSQPWPQEICIGLLVGSVPPVLFFLIARQLGDTSVSRTALDLHHVLTQTFPALGSILLVALHEELVFRGYLLQLISQKTGRTVAALITGALFGLAHGANSAANPQGLVFTAIGGVLLAWLVMRNGALWVAAGYHAGWNATASLALGLTVSGTTSPGSWITTVLSGPRWISGASYGFESSVVAGLAEPLVLGTLVWLAPRLPSHPQLRRFSEKQSVTES
jgi:membrane protease YdiL (CAAX protease family)